MFLPQAAQLIMHSSYRGKYKGRILWMLKDGVKRYGGLRKLMIGVTPKMLTQVLRELETDNLINRIAYPEVPPKVEYELTPTALDLLPSIKLLTLWGNSKCR